MAQQIIVTKDNYGIGLSCNFIDKNKNPIDLTDKVVEVVIVDSNNETIDIKQAVIVDYTNAKASIVLEKIHTSTLGLHKTFWSVLDENQNITAQEDVYYYVKDKNGGASNDSYVQEEKLDNESIIDKFKETDAEIEGIKKDISHLYNVSANAELADARGEYGTLGERLDDVDNDLTGVHLEIENINASFDNYATKTELGNYSLIDHTHSVSSIDGISDYATKNELSDYALDGHMHTTDNINGITAYATKKYVETTFTTQEYVNNKYDELFQSVSNGKELLASAITDKGVTTLATDSFEVMANNIRKITTGGGDTGGGDTQPSPSYDIIPSQSSYTIKAGQDLLVNFTSSVTLSTCMLLFAPDYSNDYVGGYISKAGEFTFYTSSRSTGTYSVKIKGRRFNDSTQTYDDYYSDIFTLIIEDNTSGGGSEGGETITPITIGNIDDITVNSGTTFNIVYTTNVDAVKHEMSFDGGSSYNVIYPSGDKNGYTYEHEPLTETSYPHQRKIRVTDSNGNIATSNTFNITVNSSGEIEDSYDITIAQSSYTIKPGVDIKVNYTSSVTLSTCMLLYAPDFSETGGYSGGYISASNEFTFYTSSKPTGTYTVKVKGRVWNDFTSSYDDYYSNIFTIVIEDSASDGGNGGNGGSGETTTPITISNINDMTVPSGKVFNITYTTNIDAVQHEMSFDGGSTFHTIHPRGNKFGYTYEHEALTETAYPHQRIIRVMDANGNVATSNTFNINVSTNGGGGGSTMSPFLASMYGDPRVIPNYPSGIQFPPINAHEDGIQPNGVNTTDSWKYGTRINQKPREDWTRVGFWGQVYRQEGYGYDPDNVAVEVKDCKLWGWNGSSWVLIHDVSFSAYNTSFYVESFAGDSNKTFPSNLKLNGKNVTVKFDSVNSGYMFHPYSGKARANDYGLPKPYYYCSTMSARLVKWDSSGADNLDSAKLCFNVGGDFWHTTHETWQPDWSANGEYAQGQFLKCTREWKTAYCTNVPESWGNGFPSL